MNNLFNEVSKISKRIEIPHLLKSNNLLGNICEVGVFKGRNFRFYAAQNPKLLIGVDIWALKRHLNHYHNLLETYKDKKNCVFMKMTSEEASTQFENNFFDYVYIDAGHKYEHVKKDLEVWFPKIKTGGIIAGHDYKEFYSEKLKHEYGIIKAVDEFRDNNKIKYFHLTSEITPSWLIIKDE